MTRNRAPAADLPRIVRAPAAHVVTAVPLKPAARILRPNPTVAAPDRKRLGGIDPEEVQVRIVAFGTEPRPLEPAGGKFGTAVGHVLAAEDAECEHLFRRQLRTERRCEIPAGRFGPVIHVTTLHPVVDDDSALRQPFP